MEKIVIVAEEQTPEERHYVQPMKIHAWLGERRLGTFKSPFFSSARLLLAEGVDSATPLVMRWKGGGFDALTSTVGKAAALTVSHPDGKRTGSWQDLTPKIVPYVPFDKSVFHNEETP